MGTGGVKKWALEASQIAEKLNHAIQVCDFELGDGTNVFQLQQVDVGEFVVNWFGKQWIIRISPQ